MHVSKIAVNLSMKVQPVRFEPFEVGTFVEVTLNEGDDINKAREIARFLAADMLETNLKHELDNLYGSDTANKVLNGLKEKH